MKLKISNINLYSSTSKLVESINNVIRNEKNLIFLDLSWAKLLPKDLADISCMLQYNFEALRNINFSYNKLNFNPNDPKDT